MAVGGPIGRPSRHDFDATETGAGSGFREAEREAGLGRTAV